MIVQNRSWFVWRSATSDWSSKNFAISKVISTGNLCGARNGWTGAIQGNLRHFWRYSPLFLLQDVLFVTLMEVMNMLLVYVLASLFGGPAISRDSVSTSMRGP